MKNRVLRIALVVLALAGQAAAGFFVFRAEQQKTAARESLGSLTRDAGRAQAMIGDLHGTQTGLVANGQDPDFWVPKVTALVQDTTAALKSLDRGPLAAESAQDLAAATDALASFTRTSDRVRDLLATHQPLTASSVAFGDASQHLSAAAAALASVAPSQAWAIEREATRIRQLEAGALLGAAGLTLIVLLLLLPRAGPVSTATSESEAQAPGLGLPLAVPTSVEMDALGRTGFDLDIQDGAPSPPTEVLPERPHESEEDLARSLQRESQLRLNTDAQVDLAGAARLCSDLARVKDGSELPGLLARAADLLDASGIVLWIVGPEGTVLRPAASHGYSDHTLAKMKTLSGRSENAVSVAFRTGRMEVVRGGTDRNGAVVTPINASAGCVGAMAAEIRHGAEMNPSVQAVATIIAAQLATLVAETTPA
ncbi:MAG TPA: hypothetical protein VF332_11245 [Vicinamibacterales bacterium]